MRFLTLLHLVSLVILRADVSEMIINAVEIIPTDIHEVPEQQEVDLCTCKVSRRWEYSWWA